MQLGVRLKTSLGHSISFLINCISFAGAYRNLEEIQSPSGGRRRFNGTKRESADSVDQLRINGWRRGFHRDLIVRFSPSIFPFSSVGSINNGGSMAGRENLTVRQWGLPQVNFLPVFCWSDADILLPVYLIMEHVEWRGQIIFLLDFWRCPATTSSPF